MKWRCYVCGKEWRDEDTSAIFHADMGCLAYGPMTACSVTLYKFGETYVCAECLNKLVKYVCDLYKQERRGRRGQRRPEGER